MFELFDLPFSLLAADLLREHEAAQEQLRGQVVWGEVPEYVHAFRSRDLTRTFERRYYALEAAYQARGLPTPTPLSGPSLW